MGTLADIQYNLEPITEGVKALGMPIARAMSGLNSEGIITPLGWSPETRTFNSQLIKDIHSLWNEEARKDTMKFDQQLHDDWGVGYTGSADAGDFNSDRDAAQFAGNFIPTPIGAPKLVSALGSVPGTLGKIGRGLATGVDAAVDLALPATAGGRPLAAMAKSGMVGSGLYGATKGAASAYGALRSPPEPTPEEWMKIFDSLMADGDAAGARGALEEYYEAQAKERMESTESAPNLAAPFARGGLATMTDYLTAYENGLRPRDQLALAEQYPDAIEGEFEDGDSYIGEDDNYTYYECGGQVQHLSIGGFLKKAIKKVAKVVSKAAPFIGLIPGVGTLAAAAIGGISGAIANGGWKGALTGAISGATGGIGGGIASGLMSKLGGSALAKVTSAMVGNVASSALNSAAQKLASDPSGQSLTEEEVTAMNDAAAQRTAALEAVQKTPANQFAANYKPVAAPPRIDPGSQSQGLLSQITAQRAAAKQPLASNTQPSGLLNQITEQRPQLAA